MSVPRAAQRTGAIVDKTTYFITKIQYDKKNATMWTNGLIAAAAVGSVVALIVVCCWLSSLVQCVQHMYRYWCTCCHQKHKDFCDTNALRQARIILNRRAETSTGLNLGPLPPSYSSVFRQDMNSGGTIAQPLCGGASGLGSGGDTATSHDHSVASVVVHHMGGSDYSSTVRYHNEVLGSRTDCSHQPSISCLPSTDAHNHSHHQYHQRYQPEKYDTTVTIDTDPLPFCPSMYELDRELCNKRPHYYQLVFTQSPDDDEAEYPDVSSPFINFPRRGHGASPFNPYASSPWGASGLYRSPPTFTRSVSSKPVLESSSPTAQYISPPGSDVFQYIKRPTPPQSAPPTSSSSSAPPPLHPTAPPLVTQQSAPAPAPSCVHLVNHHAVVNQCQLAFLSEHSTQHHSQLSLTSTNQTQQHPS